MSIEAMKQALDAWERGADANDYFSEIAALRQAIEEAEKQAPVPCIVGIKGSAFDLPTTKRAYTYANQPNNGVAHRLGMASYSANCERAGDGIDMGLILLKYLQAAGYGVFDLGAEYAASNKPDVILISEGEDHVS